MKVLSTSQIREADAYTITHEPISSLDLMERAAECLAAWFIHLFPARGPVYVIAGPGNNGGDGLALARLLTQEGYQVQVFCLAEQLSPDAQQMLQRLEKLVEVAHIHAFKDLPQDLSSGILVDALFGSGLSRPLSGLVAQAVEWMNALPLPKVAIDLPSGLLADAPSPGQAVAKADYTATFQSPKLAFFMPENEEFVGRWSVLDIGLHPTFLAEVHTPYHWLSAASLPVLRKRRRHAHKGDMGRALLVAGSLGKMGAAVLAARACLRAGAGLLTCHIPGVGYDIVQTAVPEALVEVDEAEYYIKRTEWLVAGYDALGIGPGLDQKQGTI
ncbi:MAG: NAD(P)H-hydrate epimerase, partial [Cytophagales bacterium]|nr:NAD(P)H-hydrate epimerase [Cytophagales bacterium]